MLSQIKLLFCIPLLCTHPTLFSMVKLLSHVTEYPVQYSWGLRERPIQHKLWNKAGSWLHLSFVFLVSFLKRLTFVFAKLPFTIFSHSIVSYKVFCCVVNGGSTHMLGALGPMPLQLFHFSECTNICLQWCCCLAKHSVTPVVSVSGLCSIIIENCFHHLSWSLALVDEHTLNAPHEKLKTKQFFPPSPFFMC